MKRVIQNSNILARILKKSAEIGEVKDKKTSSIGENSWIIFIFPLSMFGLLSCDNVGGIGNAIQGNGPQWSKMIMALNKK